MIFSFNDFQDNIYIPKTRKYFKEVTSSFNNGNFRSSIVMLYSLVICDLLYKLIELKDIYDDKAATEMLRKIEGIRNQKEYSKSKWEKDLIDEIHSNTCLIENDTYVNINHLFNHRNLCAHPVLNSNYDLYSPNKETVLSHIRNIFEGLFSKPSFFISEITNSILVEISQKKDMYTDDLQSLKNMLQNKYFKRMSDEKFFSVFKGIWKLVYKTDNDECLKNQLINNQCLFIMLTTKNDFLLERIKEDPKPFEMAFKETCFDRENLILTLCCNISEFFNVLSKEFKVELEKRWIISENQTHFLLWFKFKTFEEYYQSLTKEEENCSKFIDPTIFQRMKKHFLREGKGKKWIEFSILWFSKSGSFDVSDQLFDQLIVPILNLLDLKQLEKLLECISKNDQIFNRNSSRRDNTKIFEATHERLPLKENYFDNFPNFEYTNTDG